MATVDPRIDAYIRDAAEYARPILTRLRKLVHAACPDVVETLKWRTPTFEYKGMLCGMAAFKAHCTFGFWKDALIVDKADRAAREALDRCGRIAAPSDLPPDRKITGWIRQAMKLNEDGVKLARPRREKKSISVPADLAAALRKNKKASATFAAFSPSHRREYVEWITEAKQDATRRRRLATAIEWMAEGKPRNWKYMKC